MRILMISTFFNSLTQRIYCEIKDAGHSVSVQFAINYEKMISSVNLFSPDIIICPFLTQFIPSSIYNNIPTFIIHPGPIGDKGAYSLDYAILDEKAVWGVTIIKANGEFDGGDIYAQKNFSMRNTRKASLYRQEVNNAASKVIKTLLSQIAEDKMKAIAQLPTKIHKTLTQKNRKIYWENDNTKIIIKKINAADSHPGVLDNFLGVDCYIFGAHNEDFSFSPNLLEKQKNSSIKEIFAKRNGAICVKTVDGAVWISHLKELGKFKLPSTYILKDKLKGVKEYRIPLIMERNIDTFYEISLDIKNSVAYLYFDFHNGAFSAEQSIRLKYAIESMKNRCKVLILMGGQEFFSNGIHLNILEDSKKIGEDGWSNINAMNDLVRSILLVDDFLTISAFRGNAGAGGVFLGLACDYIVARKGVIFNPHYKTIGLSGSEFHTYTLPKRVGGKEAHKLLNEALPISATKAQSIGMVDYLFSQEMDKFYIELDNFAQSLVEGDNLWYDILSVKRDNLEKNEELIKSLHRKELNKMYPEFWDSTSSFHKLRNAFVYKLCPTTTPERLKDGRCMNIV